MRCASKSHQFCSTLAQFLAKFCVISMPMARFLGARRDVEPLTSCNGIVRFARRALATECVLCAHRGKTTEICNRFEASSSQILRKVDAERVLFRHERATHSIKNYADILRFSWCTPADSCMRCVTKLWKLCSTLAWLLAKFCAISMPMARFLGARRDADYAKSCAGIARFARHALAKECLSFVRSPRQIRRSLQPNWGVKTPSSSNFAQGRHRTRIFSAWMRHRFDQLLHRHLTDFLARAG